MTFDEIVPIVNVFWMILSAVYFIYSILPITRSDSLWNSTYVVVKKSSQLGVKKLSSKHYIRRNK